MGTFRISIEQGQPDLIEKLGLQYCNSRARALIAAVATFSRQGPFQRLGYPGLGSFRFGYLPRCLGRYSRQEV